MTDPFSHPQPRTGPRLAPRGEAAAFEPLASAAILPFGNEPYPDPDAANTAYPPLAPIDLLIRDSVAEDLPRIAEIYAPHVLGGLSTFEEEPPDVAALARRRDEVIARGYPYLVAEQRNLVMAYAYAGPFRMRTAYRFTVEDSIYVSREAVGRGIGRTLLAELIARATGLGLRQMMAVIGTAGASASIRMHARLGFRQVGLLPQVGWKRGRWIDATLMQLPLGPGGLHPPSDP